MPSHSKSRQPISRGRPREREEERASAREKNAREAARKRERKRGISRERSTSGEIQSRGRECANAIANALSHCNFVLAVESPEEKDLEQAKYCNCVIMRENVASSRVYMCVGDGKKFRVISQEFVSRASLLRVPRSRRPGGASSQARVIFHPYDLLVITTDIIREVISSRARVSLLFFSALYEERLSTNCQSSRREMTFIASGEGISRRVYASRRSSHREAQRASSNTVTREGKKPPCGSPTRISAEMPTRNPPSVRPSARTLRGTDTVSEFLRCDDVPAAITQSVIRKDRRTK